MVEYYFESIKRQKELKRILDEWLGTPFRHLCGMKGLGCDCIHFGARVFEELELLTDIVISDYPKDWHLHNTRELLKEGLIKNLNVEKVELSDLMNGDIILSHFGRAASHVGIYFDGYVYQALNDIGVRKINFNDKKFRERMRFAYRILKELKGTIINKLDLDEQDKYLMSGKGKNVTYKVLKGFKRIKE